MNRNNAFEEGVKVNDPFHHFYVSDDIDQHVADAISGAHKDLQCAKYPGNCDEASEIISRHLAKHNIEHEITHGHFARPDEDYNSVSVPMSRDHVWVNVGGTIIDPTASQFRHVEPGHFTPEHYYEDEQQ